MKIRKQILISCAAIGAMLMIILDAKTAIEGASEGIQMCLQVVIVSLFPFIFLSMFATSGLSGVRIRFIGPIAALCGIPKGAEYILLTSLLGGYPVGAQAVYRAWNEHVLDTDTAKRLLGFCNNAGPSFIFGLLGTVFSNTFVPWVLWLIHIGSALLVGIIIPGKRVSSCKAIKGQPLSATDALHASLRVMAGICGWVMLFRILLNFAEKYFLFLLPDILRIIICGALELTNGCLSLRMVESEPIRFMLASVLLSTGGLCVLFQTRSVTGKLGTGLYYPGKLLQAGISLIACWMVLPFLYQHTRSWAYMPALCMGCILCVLAIIYVKKVVAFYGKLVYNGNSL